jgi:hypothetical protein
MTPSQSIVECSGTHLLSKLWTTEIGMIVVLGQTRKQMFLRHHFKKGKLDPGLHPCHLSHIRKLKIGVLQSRSDWPKKETLSQNN